MDGFDTAYKHKCYREVDLKSDGMTEHLAGRGCASRYMARRKVTRQATELTTV